MATMYSLFLGFLFTAVCSDNGGGSGVLRPDVATPSYVMSLCPDASGTVVEDLFRFLGTSTDFIEIDFNNSLFSRKPQLSFSMTRTYFFSAKKYAKNSSLKTFDTKSVHPSTIVKNFVGDKGREFTENASLCCSPRPFYSVSASTSLQLEIMSPVKILTIAMGGTNVRSEYSSDDFCFFLGKRRSLSGDEDNNKIRNNKTLLAESRQSIIAIASKELGTSEATGNNDGPRVEEYLRYTNLGKGYEWCAAFVSWVYGQAGFAVPRNAWSPALFPKARLIVKGKAQQADVFGVYGAKAKRINHVGLVKELSKDYLITIEGNSNDRVESRRRHLKTVYAVGDWVNEILVFST